MEKTIGYFSPSGWDDACNYKYVVFKLIEHAKLFANFASLKDSTNSSYVELRDVPLFTSHHKNEVQGYKYVHGWYVETGIIKEFLEIMELEEYAEDRSS